MASPKLTRRQFASIVNRNQAPEFIRQLTTTGAAVVSQFLGQAVPLSRPLESLLIVLKMRVVIGTADYTTVAAEAPQSFIQKIRLTGTHSQFNALAPFDMSGATAYAWSAMFKRSATFMTINGVIQSDPSSPFAQTAANFGAQGTYDIEMHYVIPTAIVFGPGARATVVPFMLQPRDWNDSLQLQIVTGDKTAFGTPAGGTTVTFSAFGSGAGTPTIDVYGNYSLLGPLADAINGVVCVRNENPVTGAVTAIGTNLNLYNLQKKLTTNIVVKSGTILAGSTAGVEVFGTLVDTILNRTQVIADNKPIRNTNGNQALKSYVRRMMDANAVAGYLPITFVDSQNPLTALRGDLVNAGAVFNLQTDVLSAGATQGVKVVQEMIYGAAAR